MNAGTAVESPPKSKRQKSEKSSDPTPKTQPPYAIIIFNDEEHTFPYVIETFRKVFGYPVEKCCALALQIHDAGKGIVWSGSREVAELKRDQIRSSGPDFYAVNKVDFPLGVTIEPLPG
jgi:ATP-dependent Clp protease adaptor protein ClpS